MKNPRLIPYLLVIIQLICITYIILSGPLLTQQSIFLLLESIGIILGFWSIVVMKLDNLRIPPVVYTNTKLRTMGPYKLTRHPMYTAVLLVCIPLTVSEINGYRIIACMILVIDLWIKIEMEEKQLLKKFPEYAEYKRKTYKILPFLY